MSIPNIFDLAQQLDVSKMLLLELKYYAYREHEGPKTIFKDSHTFFRSTKDK